MQDDGRLTIGALADAAGVGRETVRFYEREGLIADPRRIGDALGRLVERCEAGQPTGDCPILEELEEGEEGEEARRAMAA